MSGGAARPPGRQAKSSHAAAQPIPLPLVGGYGKVVRGQVALVVGAEWPEQAEVRTWVHMGSQARLHRVAAWAA